MQICRAFFAASAEECFAVRDTLDRASGLRIEAPHQGKCRAAFLLNLLIGVTEWDEEGSNTWGLAGSNGNLAGHGFQSLTATIKELSRARQRSRAHQGRTPVLDTKQDLDI